MKAIIFFILVIALSYVAGQWLSQRAMDEARNADEALVYSTCDPTKQICKVDTAGNSYILQFKEIPSALTPFVVQIKVENLQPDLIELSFDMDGMDMGYNKHRLVRGETDWQAKVILPVCSLGRNDWLLNVKMKFKNDISITQFRFSRFKK